MLHRPVSIPVVNCVMEMSFSFFFVVIQLTTSSARTFMPPTQSTSVSLTSQTHHGPVKRCVFCHPYLLELQSPALFCPTTPSSGTSPFVECSTCGTTFCSACIRRFNMYVTTLMKPKLHTTVIKNDRSLQTLRCMLSASMSQTSCTVSRCTSCCMKNHNELNAARTSAEVPNPPPSALSTSASVTSR